MIFGRRTPSSEYALVPGTEVPEPIHGREKDYRPWEAPPRLSVEENLEVAMHQAEVVDMYLRLINGHLRASLPRATVEAVAALLIPHAGQDLKDYQGNHERSLLTLDELNLSRAEKKVNAKVDMGTASIAEIGADFERTLRGSGELAILRTVGGHRAQYVDPMMRELAEFMGDYYQPSDPRKFRVISLDDNFRQGLPMESITLGYKQNFGKKPSGTEVDSRNAFVLRMDEASGFDQSVRASVNYAAKENPQHITQLKRFGDVIEEVAETGPAHNLVAAAATKIYLFNLMVDQQIAERYARAPRTEVDDED